MKKSVRVGAFLAAFALLVPVTLLAADDTGEDWKSLKADSKRAKINETADAALDEVMNKNWKAQELFETAYGWAVFDNLKIAFLISGGGSDAIEKGSGKRTYMKMGTAGIGLGLGGQAYQVVFLFQDEKTFFNFVEKGWKADASAQAAAGEDGANATTGFVNGVAVWQITDSGLMALADIAGTKYWKNKKLN